MHKEWFWKKKLLENSTLILAKTPKNQFYVILSYVYYELDFSWRLDVPVLNFLDKTQENLSKDILPPEYYFHSKKFLCLSIIPGAVYWDQNI